MDRCVHLDVTADLQQGREPFGRIMAAVDALLPEQELCLLAPIEPTPLLAVMRQRGFAHAVRRRDDGTFEVRFTRRPGVALRPAPAGHPECPACPSAPSAPPQRPDR